MYSNKTVSMYIACTVVVSMSPGQHTVSCLCYCLYVGSSWYKSRSEGDQLVIGQTRSDFCSYRRTYIQSKNSI